MPSRNFIWASAGLTASIAGRRFFARSPQSLPVRDRVSGLLQRSGNIDVREYLSADYLILYTVDSDLGTTQQFVTVYLLAIRHHRRLSFDFESFWRDAGGNGLDGAIYENPTTLHDPSG